MYIIGDKLEIKDRYNSLSSTNFMKSLVNNLTQGLIKSTDERGHSHLYVEMSNTDKTALVCCRFS